jgi:hypothetical protein
MRIIRIWDVELQRSARKRYNITLPPFIPESDELFLRISSLAC